MDKNEWWIRKVDVISHELYCPETLSLYVDKIEEFELVWKLYLGKEIIGTLDKSTNRIMNSEEYPQLFG